MKKNRRRLPVRSPDQATQKTQSTTGSALVHSDQAGNASKAASDNARQKALPLSWQVISGLAFVSLAGLLWAFGPTILQLVATWNREPDYSHGWFVVPIVIYLLWSNRETMPVPASGIHAGGLLLLASVIGVRIFSRWAYFDFVDGWMIPLTVIGFAWALAGRKWLIWALPGLVFLFFMVPLPFRIENELSQPLQWFATKASCFTLQLFGLPAIAEGTTILLGADRLEVERACSGLRIFMGVCALAYVYAYLVNRVWWERVVLVLAAIPIALLANATRIVFTGLVYNFFEDKTVRHFAHDWIGYGMIGFAAGLFGLTVVYMRWIVPDVESLESTTLERV